jgi:diketogulonate reductase-like aldo/keto reductase
MPYDPSLPIPEQVRTSVASSLHNFRPNAEGDNPDGEAYLDCLVLHSPFPTLAQTLEAWSALEEYVPHKIRSLGISNVGLATLRPLYAEAKIKPAVVQNRFYPQTKFDVAVRKFCRENDIVYQSFWTLTANPKLLASEPVSSLAADAAVDTMVALYCLVLGLGNTVVLDGTTNGGRMKGDLQGLDNVRRWIDADTSRKKWDSILLRFKALIREQ